MDNGQCKPAKCSRFAYSLFTKTKTGSLEKALKTRGFSAFSICEEDKEYGAKKPASDASVKTLAKKCLLMAAPPTPNSSVRSWRRICWMLMEREQLIAAPAFFHVPTHAIEHREFLRHWSARSKLLLFQLQCTANAPGTHFCLAISILMMYNIIYEAK